MFFYASEAQNHGIYDAFFASGSKNHGIYNAFVPVPSKNTGVYAVFSMLQDVNVVSICEKDKNTYFTMFLLHKRSKKSEKIAQKRSEIDFQKHLNNFRKHQQNEGF